MAIPWWVIILTATLAAGIGWMAYQLVVQNGSILLRLDALESSVRASTTARQFIIGNIFEANSVFLSVVYMDEYRLGDYLFDPDDVIIDVGAHIGAFTYLCHTKGSRAIYCFEPSNRNFELLQRNLGRVPGIHLTRAAVWRSDREQPLQLTLSGPAGENTGAHSVLAGGRCVDYPSQTLLDSDGEKRQVDTVPLDEILKRFDRVKLLKIDCEGSEFPILLTSHELHRVERIVGEVHEFDTQLMALLDPGSRLDGYSSYRLQDLVSRLQALGFCVESHPGSNHMYLLDARRD